MLDLTRLAPPSILGDISYESLRTEFVDRFVAEWAAIVADDPSLPSYDVGTLQTDPVVIAARAWSFVRMGDLAGRDDAIKALLIAFAEGTDLDHVAAGVGVERLTIVAATSTTDAIMESDARLRYRCMLAFERPAAGSSNAYLLAAMTAWPTMATGKVNGRAVHGRRGDVDVVVAAPAGRDPTADELALVRAAVTSDAVRPEATSVSVMAAVRQIYNITGGIVIASGPAPDLVVAEATARVAAAAADRRLIGAKVPSVFLGGALAGTSVLDGQLTSPGDIVTDAYTIPEVGAISLGVEVAS